MAEIPRVAIAGDGFGGLSAEESLARAPVQVTVIDRHNYHLFRPMLYQGTLVTRRLRIGVGDGSSGHWMAAVAGLICAAIAKAAASYPQTQAVIT